MLKASFSMRAVAVSLVMSIAICFGSFAFLHGHFSKNPERIFVGVDKSYWMANNRQEVIAIAQSLEGRYRKLILSPGKGMSNPTNDVVATLETWRFFGPRDLTSIFEAGENYMLHQSVLITNASPEEIAKGPYGFRGWTVLRP
jgi:hypothetical protein